jgi:hypothetical protein
MGQLPTYGTTQYSAAEAVPAKTIRNAATTAADVILRVVAVFMIISVRG